MNSPDNSKARRNQSDLKAVANLMARIGLLESEGLRQPKDEAYFAGIRSVALGIFKLVVMGEIKKGKSSFINGICGIRNLVPVHSDIATSTVFKLHHGDIREYTVHFAPKEEGAPPEKLKIPPEAVADYGTENGNPDNRKRVDFIAVAAPSPILSDGMVILDTPGVGGLFKKHRDITFKHAPKADAIFFVTDSTESPIGADEVAFLKDLQKVTGFIFFVQTKAAKVSEEARRRRMENNIEILTREAGFRRESIRYFVVDSGLKADADQSRNFEDLEDSGFVPLMQFLSGDLKRQKDKNLVSVGLLRARNKFDGIKAQITQKRLLLDADSAEKQKELSEAVARSEEAIQDWVAKQRGPLVSEFQQTLSSDMSEIQASLQLDLKPGGRILNALADKLEKVIAEGSLGAEEIYGHAPGLVQDARAAASESLLRQMKELEKRVSDLVGALSAKAGAEIVTRMPDGSSAQIAIEKEGTSLRELRLAPPEHTTFTTLRNATIGFGAGMGIATLVGGLVGSVVPVVGTVIGSTVGTIIAGAWGAGQAMAIAKTQEVSMARREVLGALDRELGNIMVMANSEFSKAVRNIEARAREAVQDMVEQCQRRIADQKRAVQERAKADRSMLAHQEKELKALEASATEIETQLAAQEKALLGRNS